MDQITFLSLWYESTWDRTPVSLAIVEHQKRNLNTLALYLGPLFTFGSGVNTLQCRQSTYSMSRRLGGVQKGGINK